MKFREFVALSFIMAFSFAVYTVTTAIFFPHIWTPSITRFETWIDHSYWTTLGIFVSYLFMKGTKVKL